MKSNVKWLYTGIVNSNYLELNSHFIINFGSVLKVCRTVTYINRIFRYASTFSESQAESTFTTVSLILSKTKGKQQCQKTIYNHKELYSMFLFVYSFLKLTNTYCLRWYWTPVQINVNIIIKIPLLV